MYMCVCVRVRLRRWVIEKYKGAYLCLWVCLCVCVSVCISILPCISLRESIMSCMDWLIISRALATATVSPHLTPLITVGMFCNTS